MRIPSTAFGPYEIATVSEVNGHAREICVKKFFYVPVVRSAGFLALLFGLVVIVFRPWRRWGRIDTWLVALPATLGVIGFCFLPDLTWARETLAPLALAEMCGLSLTLAVICIFRKRARIPASITTLVLNSSLLFGSTVFTQGATWWVYYIVPSVVASLLWSLPTLLSLVAVRRKFSWKRLGLGLLISWALVAAGTIVVICVTTEAPLYFVVVPGLTIGLPYILGFFIFATRSPLCRASITHIFGLDRGKKC